MTAVSISAVNEAVGAKNYRIPIQTYKAKCNGKSATGHLNNAPDDERLDFCRWFRVSI
jgi:hypothetical protein